VTTLTEMAGQLSVLRGTGPIDPDLARDLASAAARGQLSGHLAVWVVPPLPRTGRPCHLDGELFKHVNTGSGEP
jgi:hypothetical protein